MLHGLKVNNQQLFQWKSKFNILKL